MLDHFLSDILNHVKTYYADLIDLTPRIILAAVVFMIGWFVAGRIQVFSANRLKDRMHDPLLANFLSRLFRAIFMIMAFLLMLNIVGLKDVATSLAAGAGISAFVVGFALKDIGENFLAGILMAFKRPFAIGDIVESGGIKGTVVELNLRDTQVKSSGKNIYIPNALLVKNVLINHTHENFLYQDMQITVDTSSDMELTLQLLRSVLTSVEGILTDMPQRTFTVRAGSINSEGVTFNLGYWVRTDGKRGDSDIKSEVILKIISSFRENSISFPIQSMEVKQLPS